MFGWDNEKQQEKPGTKRGPSGKNVVNTKNTPGINPKTCGNIVGGVMDFMSFILTRSPALGLNDQEENEMGEALYETISNFPATSTSVKLLNYVAPWAGVLHIGSKIIFKRMTFIAQVKAQQNKQVIQKQQEPFPTDTRGMVFAPDPSLVN